MISSFEHKTAMLKIIHFSDLHLSCPLQSAGALFDKRFIGYLNGQVFRKHAYRPERIREAVRMILAEKPDVIVFTGDATTCSQPAEFDFALDQLSPLVRSGIPILYTPGNHDCYVPAPECRQALEKFRTALTGSDRTPSALDTPSCRFLVFDSALPVNPLLSSGRFTEDSAAFLREECGKKRKPLIALSHFPAVRQEKGLSGMRRRLYGAEHLRDALENGQLDLILCGHIHKPYELLDQRGRGEICAGSLTKTGHFDVITFDGETFRSESRVVS